MIPEGKEVSRTHGTKRPKDGENYTWKPLRNKWKRSQITGWLKVSTGDPGPPNTIINSDGEEVSLSKNPPPEMAGVTVSELEASRKSNLPITFVDKTAPDD